MCFSLQAESGHAACPTIDDVRAGGVWVNYPDASTIVHYVATEPNLLTETQYDPTRKLLTTAFADGIYPLEVFEYDQISGRAILIGTFKYREISALPRLRAEDNIVLEVERHLTDEALAGQPAQTEKVTLTLVTGPIETLEIGNCSYDAIPLSTSFKSQQPTLFNEGYVVPELGIRVYQSVGVEPIRKLVSYSPTAISQHQP